MATMRRDQKQAAKRMAVTADLLAEGYEPDELSLFHVTHRLLVEFINSEVNFELIANNIDRPNADKYGTHPDRSPRYAPEWYTAQSIKTGLHERLYGVLKTVLSCEAEDSGKRCVGGVGHACCHWDGDGHNWVRGG